MGKSNKKCIIKVLAENTGDDVTVEVQNMEVEGFENVTRQILMQIIYSIMKWRGIDDD